MSFERKFALQTDSSVANVLELALRKLARPILLWQLLIDQAATCNAMHVWASSKVAGRQV